MSDRTTISNEETSASIVDAQRPRAETQQAEIDYQQQRFTPALVEYDRERCVYQEIEERAKASPSKAAIAYRGRELSYWGLNVQANRVARYLVRMGVGKGDLVGILMRRTPQMVAAMLGVWKAGAGYVPLDPQYPPERLRFMLQDAASKLVITTSSVRDRVGEIPSKILYVDEEREQIEKENPENLDEVWSSGQVAYVIYTAGSTGAPRGVMLAHQSALSFVTWAKSAFQQEELEGVLAAASIGSGLSIFELWATLSCGGTVVLAGDLMDWWEHIDDEDPHPVRLINTLPSAMTKLMQQGSLPKSVRTVNLTGEVLNKTLVGQLSKAGALKRVNNLYGQSETTTYSTWTTVGAGDKVTAGRAVANTQLYVLDEEMQLVPGGVAGELYVGGDGLALGYWKDFRLTAERFLPNPFSKGNGSRMYRTGDVVRWQEDGQLEYLSRADQQVRLGGYRIQLEEIEAAVLDHAGVSQAAVVVRADQTGRKRLMGYVVGRGKKIDVGQLRGYLQQRLPEYMVPSAFQQLDSLPLTPNGKIDRKALAELESGETIEETGAPVLTPTEELITGVWSSLLEKSNIGRGDNFFGLGGHSLLVTQVISRIREVFQVELPMQAMFETPTVAGLAARIESSTRIEAPPLKRRSRQERIPLSFGQERLRFLSRYELETSLYNVPVAVRLRGALNIEAAKASLQEMVNRHEALRTSFPEVGDSTIQDIAAEMEVPFVVSEIREDELDRVLREQARQAFDLSHGPLIRVSLFRISSQDHVLLVVMHHIVSDGWSLGVMLREFNALYDAFSRGAASPLPPLPIQYADYSEWQREWLQGEALERQLDYWRKQLAGHETLNLPTDRPHSAKPTLAGAMERSRLPEPLVSQLKLLSDQQGVTLFMTLLAGFEILLYRYTGQTDISVGMGIANRNRQELEPLIGFFVNTLVLRTRFTEDSSVAELLERVREVSLQAYAHQDIPFERLVEALDPVRELSRTPLFHVMFVLQNAPLPTVSWDGLEATASILATGTAKFDLTLSAREEDGELELSLEYRTELFNAERMKRLLQHYRTLLEGIAASVDARIGELEILSEAERQQLLVEWNRTEAEYPLHKCVHRLFEEQAAKTPQAIAVVDEDGQISYGELNRRANQLAHYLARLGVGPEVRMGICMERGLERMAGVLGVLKVGGAYVPLDPADPSARRSYMVKDAGAKFVLANERFTQQMAGCTEHVVDLKEAREEIEKQSSDNLNVHVDPENLAWVIYTSSSAGRPKGTAIPHCSAVSLMQRTLIDAMDQNLSVERWLNLYAPTKDTTYATYAEVKLDEQGAVTIGRSQSTQAYVLDGHMKLVPVGIKGKLYISGSGQARGYLNRPELTAEKFVPNPFSQTSGERLYRTGDLVRYQENGNLEFLGRLDDQVKIQGHRIEPGEIEAALLEYPGIAQAAVVAREDKLGEMRLIGYVAGGEKLDVDRLRSHLQQRVPEYMVPAALLQLDTLPLTPNGKVDRKALIELESKEAMEEAGRLTLTPTEELIAGVWSSLLGKSEIRRDDNFFDLGGHSLMVTQMLSRLRQVFNREIELRAMFESPVLKDLSAYVDRLTGPAQTTPVRPITSTSRDGDLPLSLQQEQLWFLEQITAGSTVYSLPDAVRLKGDLDKLALRLSLEEIVRRHEILRTSFVQVDSKPKQRIHETGNFELVERDLRETTTGVATEERINREQKEEATLPFLLSQPNLFRAKLLRVAEQEHILLLTFHHIVFDGWSIGVMVNELGQLYKAYHEGRSSPLPELPIQYADYTVWQREVMAEGEFIDGLEYWKKELEDLSELDLPSDHSRPAVQSFRGTVERWEMSPEVSATLRKVSQEQGVTLFMTLLAGFQILLARYSGQRDIVVGSPIANRMQPELEALIGFFVNTLVLRGKVSDDMTVEAVLQRTREVCLGAYAHQSVPFERLVDELQPERDSSRSPLFQVMLVLQNAPVGALQMQGVELSMLPSATSGARVDLTLMVEDDPEHLQGMMEYCTDVFERPTVRRMLDHYQQVLQEMVRDPKQSVSTLPLLTEAERHRLLVDWNDTKTVFASGCIHELFAQQVEKTPNAVAVEYEGREISYAELNRRANQLAHYLRKQGVKPDERVAICVERGFEMIVGLLAILKAGGAYVPLDPNYPTERLQFMLEDSAPILLLTQEHLQGLFDGIRDTVRVLDLSDAAPAWSSQPETNPDRNSVGLTSKHLAYVIYTSGSTGQPKGVMVEHRNVARLFTATAAWFQFSDKDIWSLFHSYAFDFSVWEIWGALLYGGRLVVISRETARSPQAFYKLICQERVTILNQTPSAFRQLISAQAESGEAHQLRHVIFGGEALEVASLKPWYEQNNGGSVGLINMYGITETTVHVTYRPLEQVDSERRRGDSPIGCRIPDLRIYILDSNRQPVPVGVRGEMYVGGAGVARGYLNRPELTAEKFAPNPFSQTSGERLYRTGDLVRYQENGNLEFLGRLDDQMKIQGYRIEPGEIEAALLDYAGVTQAAVITRENKLVEMRLVGYVAGSERLDVDRLRSHLQQRLPEYMVPAALLQLDTLPLTPNGKVDRKALLELESKEAREEAGSLALTPTEELIAGVWSSLLGKSDIRRDDNFFDLGGHSLMVIQMLSRLRQVFNREIDLRAMFESLILKDLATYVDQLTGSTLQTSVIPRVDRKGKLALSYGQERLWFIHQLEPENVAYNVPGAVRIQGPLDVESLERTLREIVRRHESLRTRFVSVVGEPQQIIDASVAMEVPVTALSHLEEPEREAEARRLALEDARQPFDLARGPLFRVKLLRLASQDHVLVFNMHHIVSDAWSISVLVREVSAIYNNFSTGQPSSLPELDIQYADFSAWQREFLSGSLLEKQLEYWQQKLAAVEPLMLPTDRPRTALQRPEGATTHFTVPVELTEALKTLSRKQGATLYMILLAAFQALLSRYSGQSDITVGSPIAGRSRTETEGLIGVFINTLVLRSDLSGQPDSIELLQRVKATTLEAFANQDVPFEKLVEVLLPQRDLTRMPLFQVLFVLQNVPWTVLQLGAAKMLAFDVDSGAAQFEMSLVLTETDSGMEGAIVYNKGLFEAESVTRMIGHYQMLLNGIVAEPGQSIALLPLMSVQEKKQVIEEWNRTEAQYPLDKCVHELFEEQVARTPQAVALIYEEERLTYGKLNERANQLAWYLRERGVGPDVLVGIFLERSVEMLIGLLGILKAGGGYLPLDTNFPAERLRYMVEDARPALLLTQERLEPRIVDAGAPQTLCLDRDWETVGKRPETNLQPIGSGENLTYVIYTSGSTGRPKGVMVTRQALMNFLQSMTSIPGIKQSDVLAAVTTVSFDIAGLELYLPLVTGGRILLLSRETARDAHELHRKLIEHSVTVMQATPSTWSMLLLDGWRPRSAFKILCGGEALNRDLATKLVGHDVPVWNLYGPTETTVWSCLKQLKSSEAVTIGKPIANTQVYVVDEEMEPVPVGVSGELYIGGIGLARGYLNRPELTAERFVPDPFASKNTVAGGRLYRTGDLVRWQVDGNLEYLGRLDQQVKIRGFRIELEEIEAVLERHPSVARCVVLAREDQPGEKRLVAYVVKKADAPWPNASGLEEYLKVSLPDYMVPSAYVQLDELPLNHNGKIDRKALPQPDRDTPEEEYVGPRDPSEETLCRLWQEVLRRERVGIHDNFFNIGGHSLLAVQVISRIKSAFAMEMPLSVIFVAPTVARMAKEIAALNGHEQPRSSQVLVSIQPQGSQVPFFCVHAVGGQVISYAELSRELGLEQPFYGLQSPPANFFPESDISIEQMAALYNREIRGVQPVGPYLLSGWSMGGLVAWEMAQQLIKEGETIRLLALMDTTPPSGYLEADDRGDEVSMLARFALHMSRLVGKDPRPLVEQFSQAAPQDQWNMVQETLTSSGVLAPKTAHAEMTALLDVFTRNALAMNNYSIHTSKQAVVYFRASETPERFSKLWTKWSGGGIQFHSVPGDHFTMLRQPNVRVIAEALERYISANNSNESRAVSPETSQYTF